MSTETYPSFEETAILLAREGLQDEKQHSIYSVGFQGYTGKLAHAVLEAGWTHGGAAFTADDERGYIATNLSPDSVNALPGSTDSVALGRMGDDYARKIAFVNPSVVKKSKLAEAAPNVAGGMVGGVVLGSEALVSHLSEGGAICALLAGCGGMAVALTAGHIRTRRQITAYSAAYQKLKQDIKENAHGYNTSELKLTKGVKATVKHDAVDDLTYGLWPKHRGVPMDPWRINVFGTVSGLMLAAGDYAADLWVNKLQYLASDASLAADRFQKVEADLKEENNFNTRIGERKSKRGDELQEQMEGELTTLAGHMAGFAAINAELRCNQRRHELETTIEELAVVHPIEKTHPFASDLEDVYSMLFSGLLQLNPQDKDSTAVMRAILSKFDAMAGNVSHPSHIDRMFDHFRSSYPKLFGEKSQAQATKQ